jgi:TonB family protein
MHRLLAMALVLLAGCAGSRDSITPAEAARILSLTTLPPLSSPSAAEGIRIDVKFLVRPDGTVSDVRLLSSGGSPEWDRAAADSMRRWTFALHDADSSMQPIWVRTSIIVQVQQPVILTLAELTAKTRQEADSLYALLSSGVAFEQLVRERSGNEAPRCTWFLGSVNIARYPARIREALERLRVNEFTRPLQIDSRYAMFLRLEPSQH